MKVKVREFFNVKLGDKIYQSGDEIDVTSTELELIAHQVEIVNNRREKKDGDLQS
ncbi:MULTISPECIES: hypothetical protein [Microcystis]|uniref:hypothetical protein n=1 Tax=Microcystis TaxID=1125 RepID=UPI0016808DB3|nr:hypothetical protein [Microcystis wesenbergii]MBD2117330.1 hypothetical protein [Microcystis wesenbergii FACHB-1339]